MKFCLLPQESFSSTSQDDGYEQAIFMPPERAENMAQLNLGVQFLRLGVWDDSLSVRISYSASCSTAPFKQFRAYLLLMM